MRTASFGLALAMLFGCFSEAMAETTLQYYTSGWDIRGWTWKSAAVLFTMPADDQYFLDEISMYLCGDPDAVKLDVTVWANDSGSMGSVLYELPDQDWGGSDSWNTYDLSAANLVFGPGESFYAGYTSDADAYAEIGILVDTDVDLGRSSGINIHYGPDWQSIDGELLFKAQVSPIPEPVSLIFFGTGLVGVFGFVARRRMQAKRLKA